MTALPEPLKTSPRGSCSPRNHFDPYSDSLLGARLVIDSTESVGCILNTANETRNAARQTHSSKRKALLEIGSGTTGLKSTAIARNPAAQEYLLA